MTRARTPAVRITAAVARVIAASKRRRARTMSRPPVTWAPEAPQRFLASAPHKHRFTRPGARVVVLADGSKDQAAGVAEWVAHLPAGSVTVLAARKAAAWRLAERGGRFIAAKTVAAYHDHLSRHGPVDAIIDLRRLPFPAHVKLWHTLFYHLVPGGVYALDPRLGGFAATGAQCVKWTQELIALRDAPEPAPEGSPRELARALGAVRTSPHLIMIENRVRHQLKLHFAEADDILASREPKLKVAIERALPGGAFDFPGAITSYHADVPIPDLLTRIEYPPLHLRRYEGPLTLVSNSVLHTPDTVLPDSFRHHLQRELLNPRLLYSSADFARVPPRLAARRTLEGCYYDLDSTFSGHFGHLMTEVVSRLWGWDDAKARDPDLKAIMRIRFEGAREPVLEQRIFGAYGIPPEDLLVVYEPVALESVAAVTPMWHNHRPHYVHPDIAEVWRRITDGLADASAPEYPKLFVSRRGVEKRRNCRNTRAVEERFAAAGFHVIYPETHDLADQAGIFAKARIVAGLGGSAMFNVMHSRSVEKIIVLSHEAYTARNEHLFAAVLGADIHYFWSRPDLPHPEGGWSEEAFGSDWEFDFDRNGAALDELLAAL